MMRQCLLSKVLVAASIVCSACGSSTDEENQPSQGGGTIDVGGECVATKECKQGAREVACACDGAGPQRCVELVDFGQPCDFGGAPCRSGSECNNGICMVHAKLGESCGPGVDCAAGSACDGEVCGPPAAVGFPCEFSEPEPCVEEAFCDLFDEVCVAKLPAGAECSSAQECADGASCHTQGGPATCHPVKKAGELCESGFECEDGFDCRFGDASTEKTCQPDLTPTTCL